MSVTFGDCVLDGLARSLVRQGEDVHVEPKVLDLILLLVKNRDRVVPKDELMDGLWPDAIVGEAALSRLVKEARRALGDTGSGQTIIKTFHARGYRFVAATGSDGRAAPSNVSGPVTPDDTATDRSRRERRPPAGILWLFPEVGRWSSPESALVIGRDPGADVVLSGKEVSRRHAELRRDGPITVLRDLGSHNGTYLDGARIEQAPVKTGDLVRIGGWVGIVTSRIIDGDLVEVAPDLLFGARMVEGLRPARTLAPSVTPVTFHGETGSGKSSLARAMHRWSGKEGPLVVIRCEGRAPDYSIAAEIQRHLESAAGGRATIVVDNVCDLPPKAQGELARLVDDAPEHAEAPPVRLVATTGVALKQAVAQGLLRPDLAARLSAACFDIPPLRERIEDVPALFLRFLSRFGGGSAPSVEAVLVERLCMHEWPFNVRELEQVARQLMTSSGHEPLLRAELLEPMLGAPGERERRSPLE